MELTTNFFKWDEFAAIFDADFRDKISLESVPSICYMSMQLTRVFLLATDKLDSTRVNNKPNHLKF